MTKSSIFFAVLERQMSSQFLFNSIFACHFAITIDVTPSLPDSESKD